jgi:NADH-quinone oxidoreductase subunit A
LFNIDLAYGAYSCARCHTPGWSYGDPGVTAQGAFGWNLTGGATNSHFPSEQDMINFIKVGSKNGAKYGCRARVRAVCPASVTCSPTSRSKPSSNTCGALMMQSALPGIIGNIGQGHRPWEWELRGTLIVIISVGVLCGSLYLILGTNLGARLGFLVALTGLAGWMFIMGAVWWTYGKGLLGPTPAGSQWARHVIREPGSLSARSACSVPVRTHRRVRTADAAEVSRATAGRRLEAAQLRAAVVPAGGCRGHRVPGGVGRVRSRRVRRGQCVRQGRRALAQFWDGKIDFLAFFHDPHYALVEVAPLVPQRTEPGRAPARAVIDTSRPHEYVYMIRDLGSKRVPAAIITISSLIIFLCCVGCCTLATVVCSRTGRPRRCRRRSDHMGQYLPIVCLLVLATLFGALSFFASGLLAPRRPSAAKEAPYECGIVPSREPPERFPVTFYVVAMLFIMFDIELIFIYPFAVDRSFLGSYALWEMIAFSVVFFGAFVYVIARGALDWGPVAKQRRAGSSALTPSAPAPAPSVASASKAGPWLATEDAA